MDKQFTFTNTDADFVIVKVALNGTYAFGDAVLERHDQLKTQFPDISADERGRSFLGAKAVREINASKVSIADVVEKPSYLQSVMVGVL